MSHTARRILALLGTWSLPSLVLLTASAPRAQAAAKPTAPNQVPQASSTLGDEGPLDNDSEIPQNAAAAKRLREGDELLSKLREPARDLSACTPVFEAWRAALVESSARDLVADESARFALSVEASVANRVLSISNAAPRAFSARFSRLADTELAAAADDTSALARVEHEFPFTRSAVIAALRLADLAFERGDAAFARSSIDRAAFDASFVAPSDLDAAIAARRAVFVRATNAREASAFDACTRLGSAREIALADDDAGDTTKLHLEPALAFDGAGNAWIQAGERLHRLDAKLALTSLSPVMRLASRGLNWLPAFGEKTYDWIQRPAVLGERVALVCGRTHRNRGNALVVLDASGGSASSAELAWAYTDAGFVSPDGALLPVADVLLPGKLEFQPGPIFAAGRLCVAVRQWYAKDSASDKQIVDESDTAVWLVGFDARTGLPDWKREIASGADLRGRHRDRFTEARGLSQPSAPLVGGGEFASSGLVDRVFIDTELGIASEVDASDGRALWSVRCVRTNSAVARRPTGRIALSPECAECGGPVWSWLPADAGGVLYTLRADPLEFAATGRASRFALLCPPPRKIGGLATIAGLGNSVVAGLEESEGRAQLVEIDPRTLARRSALPLGRGDRVHGLLATERRVLCASGDSLVLYDTRRDLYRLDLRRIDGLGEESALSLHQDGRRVYVVGPRKVWVFSIE